jgi:Protein of unknown function (DUF2634).
MSVLKTYGDDTTSFKPSLTYQIKNGHIDGRVDGIEAVVQAIDLLLSTERYQYLVYSTDYGTETQDLIGADRETVRADLQRRFSETLAEDDRIEGIEDFQIEFDREVAKVTFTAKTIFGKIQEERNVAIG